MSSARVRSEVFADLVRLAAYPDGWDGPDSLKMSQQTRAASERVLAHLQEPLPQPELTLNENGTLSFEWYFEPYIYLEVGNTTFAMLIRENDGNQFVNDATSELDNVIQDLLIPKLIGAKNA